MNIMVKSDNKYVIADYGEGENLNYKCHYLLTEDYQKGLYQVKGTVSWLSPKLYYRLQEAKRQ